jgi:Flp pilus assembly protein TadG
MTARAARRLGRRGGALVELALVLPMLLILTIGLLEFGLLGLRHMALTGAVRAGIDYAFQYGDVDGTRRAVQSAAGNNSATVNTNQWCECAGATVTCGGPCADNTAQQVYVSVSVSETYVPIFVNVEMIETLLGPSMTLGSNATFRVQ